MNCGVSNNNKKKERITMILSSLFAFVQSFTKFYFRIKHIRFFWGWGWVGDGMCVTTVVCLGISDKQPTRQFSEYNNMVDIIRSVQCNWSRTVAFFFHLKIHCKNTRISCLLLFIKLKHGLVKNKKQFIGVF